MGGHVQAIEKEFVANFDQYYCLLIVAPEEVNSYEAVNVLNFFGFPFNLDEDNVLRGIEKCEMAFQMEDEYPCLTVESNKKEISNMDLAGNQQIFQTLIKQGFIRDHCSHAANEKQTRTMFL
jgi:hypothetical protein